MILRLEFHVILTQTEARVHVILTETGLRLEFHVILTETEAPVPCDTD